MESAPPNPNQAPHPHPPGEVLWQPLPLGRRTLSNRIIFGAHLTNFGRGQVFTARHRGYYAARAAGGVAMLVTEALTVHPLDHPYEHVPFGHRDQIIPSLQNLAAEVRQAGNRAVAPHGGPLLLAQLNHTGGQCSGRILRQSPWAPSPVADVASKKMARAMEPEQVAEVVAGFAATAARVVAAGLDGVELNAAQYALLRQFLSPLTNFRDDAYGGPLENRARLLREVVAAVREAVGPEPLLGVRLCGDELAPWGGLTPADCTAVARLLRADGGVDYFSIQPGGPFAVHLTDAGMPIPEGQGAEPAAEVRAGFAGAGPPVFAEGRVELPQTAAELVAAGQADGVVMTRALISDPELPRKLRGANLEPVRPHVGMMRYFSVRGDWNRPVGDLANPRAGREALLPPLALVSAPGPVLVIGGGPAGLEAAATLARQGHRVRLVERGPRLGGLPLALAEAVPARREFQRLVDYQCRMVELLGVTVETGLEISGYQPWMAEFGTIFLAVGAVSRPSPWVGESGVPWLAAREVVTDPGLVPAAGPGALAVVVDREYGFRMAAAVEVLLERGLGVAVVSDDFFVGRELVESAELLWFNRVATRGVRFHPRLRAQEMRGSTLVCADRFSGAETLFGPVAAVVHAQREQPHQGLWYELRERHGAVVPIGDARAPRLVGEAILHAHRAALGMVGTPE